MRIPRGWMQHPELSDEDRPVIVPDPTYFGARADPPPSPPGAIWRYFVPCDGYRLERDGTAPGYEPDNFRGIDKAAIWDAITDVARSM